MTDFVYLIQFKVFLCIANTGKWQTFTANTVRLPYKLAESHIIQEQSVRLLVLIHQKYERISIFKILKVKSGISEHKYGKKNM